MVTLIYTTLEENSVRDSGIANMNKIVLNVVNVMVNRCNVLSISFRESDDRVIDEMCEVIKGE